jgi:Predicted protein-tyrosine phosphatase
MSSDSVTPPPEQTSGQTQRSTAAEAPRVNFSFWRWAGTGVIRVLYRRWTRIAVRLFPENSRSERIARQLHIPLPDTLNMSWITPHIAVGGRIRLEDIKALSQTGVTHVIDTRSEYCDDAEALGQEQIELLYLPTPDTYPLSVEQLMEGAIWANDRIGQDGHILIHCEHGVGRSALLACATLIYGGMQANAALELVKTKRWQAAPNKRQVERLREFDVAYRAKVQ